MNKICLNIYHFILIISILIGIILYCLYTIYNNINLLQQTYVKDILHNPKSLYDNPKSLYDNPKSLYDNPRQPQSQNHIPFIHRPRPIINPIKRIEQENDVLPNYILVGYVQSEKGNKLENMYKLYGRKDQSDKFTYYVVNELNNIKIPLQNRNGWEFNNGDIVKLNGFKGNYIVNLYYE
jgi:hypothetical protein